MKQLVLPALMACLLALPVRAAEFAAGDIVVQDPWARATPGRARNGAGYLAIRNHGAADRLLRLSSPVAKRAELHTNRMDGGIMRMRPLRHLELPGGGEVVLKPHGHHVMLMGLKAPLRKGQTFPLTLVFENAGAVEVEVTVMPVGHMGPAARGHGTDRHKPKSE